MKTLIDCLSLSLFLVFCYAAPGLAKKPSKPVETVMLCKHEYGFCVDGILYDQYMTEGYNAKLPDEIKQMLAAGIPMGRLTEPSDVAAAVTFLASDDAAYLTGVCLPVDGGRSIG